MTTRQRWEDDRLSFLRERVPEYKRAQEEKRVAEYKEKVRDEYFEHYPQPDTTLVEVETKVCTSVSVCSHRELTTCTRGYTTGTTTIPATEKSKRED